MVMIVALTASLAMAAKKETTSAGPAIISGNRKVEADFIVQIKSAFFAYTGYATGDADYFDSHGNPINLQNADVVPFGVITFTYANGEHRTMRSEMSPSWEMESIGYAPEGQTTKVKTVENYKPRVWDFGNNKKIVDAEIPYVFADR